MATSVFSLSSVRKALFCVILLMILGMLLFSPKSAFFWKMPPTDLRRQTEYSSLLSPTNGKEVGRSKQLSIRRACSQEYRLRQIRKMCHTFRSHQANSRLLQVVAINHEKKLLFCALPKSGSRAWLTYMVNVTETHPNSSWNIRSEEFMKSVGLDYRKKMPLEEVLTDYANYTKFTVVRHPLQWLVALYFEAIVNVEKYRQAGGALPTLQQFVNDLPSYPLYQKAWYSYEAHCHHCAVDYDFLVKAETVEYDGEALAALIRTDVLPQMSHVSDRVPTDEGGRNFKYDRLLHELEANQSNIVNKMLAYYDKEMAMFGYQWDADNMLSQCINEDEQGSCC